MPRLSPLLLLLGLALPSGPLLAQAGGSTLQPGAAAHSVVTTPALPGRLHDALASQPWQPAADSSYNWEAGGIGALAGAAGAVALVALFTHGGTESELGPTATYIGVAVLGGLVGFFTGLAIANP